jgi:hypothetical protein
MNSDDKDTLVDIYYSVRELLERLLVLGNSTQAEGVTTIRHKGIVAKVDWAVSYDLESPPELAPSPRALPPAILRSNPVDDTPF